MDKKRLVVKELNKLRVQIQEEQLQIYNILNQTKNLETVDLPIEYVLFNDMAALAESDNEEDALKDLFALEGAIWEQDRSSQETDSSL